MPTTESTTAAAIMAAVVNTTPAEPVFSIPLPNGPLNFRLPSYGKGVTKW